MMKSRLAVRFFVALAPVAALLHAEVRVPRIISNHMLVQRGVPVRIWGTASGGEAPRLFNGDRCDLDGGDAQALFRQPH